MSTLERIPEIRIPTIPDFVRRNIRDEAEAVYTDKYRSNVGLETDTRRHNHKGEKCVVR